MTIPALPIARSVLVTGGAGFVGWRLGHLLAERGHRVILLDRSTPIVAGSMVVRDGITALRGDITDPSTWEHHLSDAEVVVHCAALHHVGEVDRDPERATAVNIGGTRAVLEASVLHGVDRFVFLSTSKVYGDVPAGCAVETDPPAPADHYSHTKVVSEALCAAAHDRGEIETVVVRPFSVYGPHQDVHTGYVGALVAAAVSGAPVSLAGEPSFVRDFVHIDTVVELLVAIVEARTLPYRVWNAGSGRSTTLDELVRTFAGVSDLTQPVTYRTPGEGTVTRTSADMTRARVLVRDDDRQLADGLMDTLETHRRNIARERGESW